MTLEDVASSVAVGVGRGEEAGGGVVRALWRAASALLLAAREGARPPNSHHPRPRPTKKAAHR